MTSTDETKEPFRVAVFADFVCPYSFLAVEQIDRLASEYGVTPMCAHTGCTRIRRPKAARATPAPMPLPRPSGAMRG